MDSTDQVKTYYSKNGRECDEEVAFAYKWDKNGKTLYYVKEYCGALLKKETIVTKENRVRCKFRKVGQRCFTFYLKYLAENGESHYNIAFRDIDA